MFNLRERLLVYCVKHKLLNKNFLLIKGSFFYKNKFRKNKTKNRRIVSLTTIIISIRKTINFDYFRTNMSHFTTMKTSFQNLVYLEKALNKLQISHQKQNSTNQSAFANLIINQSNGYDIEFAWNGNEYELIVDMSFWEQSCPVESFIDKVAQQYAGEVIVGESQKLGFQPIKYQQNEDGSNTVVLERWNEKA